MYNEHGAQPFPDRIRHFQQLLAASPVQAEGKRRFDVDETASQKLKTFA